MFEDSRPIGIDWLRKQATRTNNPPRVREFYRCAVVGAERKRIGRGRFLSDDLIKELAKVGGWRSLIPDTPKGGGGVSFISNPQRTAICHQCGRGLDNRINQTCACGGIVCCCGACRCNYSPTHWYDEEGNLNSTE
jgi:hypothetical protein